MVAPMMDWLRTQCHRSGECTHLSLGSVKGSFTVSKSLDDAFRLKYARAIAASAEHLSLIEVKTSVFPLFADLDWKTPVSRERLREVAKFVSQQAFLIYAPSSAEQAVVVATRQPVERDGHYKNGMHIHWPGIYTTAASAQVFRNTTVERCRERFGCDCNWEDTIDEHVYKGSGLRMLYSRKQSAEDVYTPTWAMQLVLEDMSGLRQAVLRDMTDIPPATSSDDIHHWLQQCSVRHQGGADGNKTPLQECVEEVEKETGVREQCDMGPHGPGLEALKQVLPECYRTCTFVKLTKGEDRAFLTPNIRTCLNLQPDPITGRPGAHKSNNVYFVISSDTTYQACFCSCETEEGRLNGPCKTFKSNHFRTPPLLAQSLFPRQVKPFACGGMAFTSEAATAGTMFDRFFGPNANKTKAPAKRKRQKKC